MPSTPTYLLNGLGRIWHDVPHFGFTRLVVISLYKVEDFMFGSRQKVCRCLGIYLALLCKWMAHWVLFLRLKHFAVWNIVEMS